ncbi:unnamed protein product, partial [Scytosiphon promiscuus]
MDVKDLKAKAVELGIPTGGRKSQLKARIKQKLSVSCRGSDGEDTAATASAASPGHDDPAAAAAADTGKIVAATAASAEGAATFVTAPAKAASASQGPGTEEGIPSSADGSRLGRLETPDPGVLVAADTFASPEPPAAEGGREGEEATSDAEYQDATGPSESTPPPFGQIIRRLSLSAGSGAAAGGEEPPGSRAVVAAEESDPTEELDGSLASSPGPLLPQTPGGFSYEGFLGATNGVAVGSARPSLSDPKQA